MSNSEQLENSIIIEDGQTVTITDSIIAPEEEPAVNIIGNNAQLIVTSTGSIATEAEDDDDDDDGGNTAIQSLGDNVEILNAGGFISGDFNGIDSDGNGFSLINEGIISSDSRAVQLDDGNGINLLNAGLILGTGNQRNGTLYVDGTVDNATIENLNLIDAGEGNIGDGFSAQVGAVSEDALNENINIINSGTIIGRGQAEFSPEEGRLTANGSSGVRFFNGSEQPEAILTGSLNNSGTIAAEVNVGFLGGVVVEDGVGFNGTIDNSGLITGPRNGLYIGNAQHNLTINNTGSIQSGSRAVNLDGDNVSFNNAGSVLGTGDQRNGTAYIDGTGDNITIINSGSIDAGEGNSGSGVSVQVGTANGFAEGSNDIETFANIINDGLIQGRGTENVPAGVRLFVGSGLTESTFIGNITNSSNGIIASENQAGILIESGVIFDGEIVNDGIIRGGNGFAIDANGAGGSVNVVNNAVLEGIARLGNGNDLFTQNSSQAVRVEGGAGSDTLVGGIGNDTLQGGGGSDITDGGEGIDTADFSDIGFAVTANLATGEATYTPGFSLTVDDASFVDQRDPDILTSEEILDELAAGNGYINVHTVDNPSGEIRGQLALTDSTDGIFLFEGIVEGSQEVATVDGEFVPNPVDTPATGFGTLTVDTNANTYDFDLSVSNLDPNNLLSVPVGGPTPDSPIHIHNAPVGQNGPIPLNVADPNISSLTPTVVTDTLISIENLTGSLNNDLLIGDANANVLAGNEGNDTLSGGSSADTFSFGINSGVDIVTDFESIDILDVGAFFSDANQVLGAAIQDGNSTFIDFGDGNSVTLENFAVSDLTVDNFLLA